MENKISKFDRKPLVYKRCLTKEFLKSINNASNELFNRQITYIKKRLNFYDKVKELPKNIRKQKAREIVNEWKNDIIYTWRKENPVYRLSNSKKIKNIKES